MIHEIAPHQFDFSFQKKEPNENDLVLCFDQNRVFLKKTCDGKTSIPVFADLDSVLLHQSPDYLFSIDHQSFFLVQKENLKQLSNLSVFPISVFRTFLPEYLAFGGITAFQLFRFFESRKFCGCCGARTERSESENALVCPACFQTEYPNISPAVIVAVTDKNRLLLARNINYGHFSLLAGYVEVGETLEQAVHREVMEEVGLNIKNIRYYKSQPWAFSQSIMIGFFAELSGSDHITLQESELSEAGWYHRDELPDKLSHISLGSEMIECFKKSQIE